MLMWLIISQASISLDVAIKMLERAWSQNPWSTQAFHIELQHGFIICILFLASTGFCLEEDSRMYHAERRDSQKFWKPWREAAAIPHDKIGQKILTWLVSRKIDQLRRRNYEDLLVSFSQTGLSSLTPNVRGPSYLGLTRSLSWLLMPWLLTSPGHQQSWYWLCSIGRFLSYLRKDFKYLLRTNVEKWHKMWIDVYVLSWKCCT